MTLNTKESGSTEISIIQWYVLENLRHSLPYHTNVNKEAADKAYSWAVANNYVDYDNELTDDGEELLLTATIEDYLMYKLFFPNLTGKWAQVDLNQESLVLEEAPFVEKFGTLDVTIPSVQEKMVQILHAKLGVDYSWGGYLECRRNLFKNHYHATYGTDHFWHLGVDYNVPADTPVSLPVNGELIYSNMEPDTEGGWGGILVFKVANPLHEGHLYLILAHLDSLVTEKRQYKKGEVVAKVGTWPTNGNWFPHLHVQCCSECPVKDGKIVVDGYSHYYEGIDRDYPHPGSVLVFPLGG